MSNRNRPSSLFGPNEQGLVDTFIGTAYDVVREVYDNLDIIKATDPLSKRDLDNFTFEGTEPLKLINTDKTQLHITHTNNQIKLTLFDSVVNKVKYEVLFDKKGTVLTDSDVTTIVSKGNTKVVTSDAVYTEINKLTALIEDIGITDNPTYESISIKDSKDNIITISNDGVSLNIDGNKFIMDTDIALSLEDNGNKVTPLKLTKKLDLDIKKTELSINNLNTRIDNIDLNVYPEDNSYPVYKSVNEAKEDTNLLDDSLFNVIINKSTMYLYKKVDVNNIQFISKPKELKNNTMIQKLEDDKASFIIADSQGSIGLLLNENKDLNIKAFETLTVETNLIDENFTISDLNRNELFKINKKGLVELNADNEFGSAYLEEGNLYLIFGNSVLFIGSNVKGFSQHNNIIDYVITRRGIPLQKRAVISKELNEVKIQSNTTQYNNALFSHHILITGQSLAVGNANTTIYTKPLKSNIYTFNKGSMFNGKILPNSPITNLKEFNWGAIGYGLGKGLETINKEYIDKESLLISGQALGGANYDAIKKGGSSGVYEALIQHPTIAKRNCDGTLVTALILIHGEADGYSNNTEYANNITNLLEDYHLDIKKDNKQNNVFPMLFCQTSSAAGYLDISNRDKFVTPLEQLKLSNSHPYAFLVTPKYHLTYSDHAHITAESAGILGEYYSIVYDEVVIQGNDWKPTQPKEFKVKDNTLIIDYITPVGDIELDTINVLVGSDNLNFGFVSLTPDLNLISVDKTNKKQITLTFDRNLKSKDKISYALHNGTYRNSGKELGARGNVRDSSDKVSSLVDGFFLYNWSVSFKFEV